jgi:hypothetical protein
MKSLEIQVELTREASKEFEEIRDHSYYTVSSQAENYLRQLLRYPLDRWKTIQKDWKTSAFRSEPQLPFDIRGKVCYDRSGHARTVLITRFKLRIRPDIWGWEKNAAFRQSWGSSRLN